MDIVSQIPIHRQNFRGDRRIQVCKDLLFHKFDIVIGHFIIYTALAFVATTICCTCPAPVKIFLLQIFINQIYIIVFVYLGNVIVPAIISLRYFEA